MGYNMPPGSGRLPTNELPPGFVVTSVTPAPMVNELPPNFVATSVTPAAEISELPLNFVPLSRHQTPASDKSPVPPGFIPQNVIPALAGGQSPMIQISPELPPGFIPQSAPPPTSSKASKKKKRRNKARGEEEDGRTTPTLINPRPELQSRAGSSSGVSFGMPLQGVPSSIGVGPPALPASPRPMQFSLDPSTAQGMPMPGGFSPSGEPPRPLSPRPDLGTSQPIFGQNHFFDDLGTHEAPRPRSPRPDILRGGSFGANDPEPFVPPRPKNFGLSRPIVGLARIRSPQVLSREFDPPPLPVTSAMATSTNSSGGQRSGRHQPMAPRPVPAPSDIPPGLSRPARFSGYGVGIEPGMPMTGSGGPPIAGLPRTDSYRSDYLGRRPQNDDEGPVIPPRSPYTLSDLEPMERPRDSMYTFTTTPAQRYGRPSSAASNRSAGSTGSTRIRIVPPPESDTSSRRDSRVYPRTPRHRGQPNFGGSDDGRDEMTTPRPQTPIHPVALESERPIYRFTDRNSAALKRQDSRLSIGSNGSYQHYDRTSPGTSPVDLAYMASGPSRLSVNGGDGNEWS